MIIVLKTSGKHESVDYAEVRLFDDRKSANVYCDMVSTGHKKYWVNAEIISEGKEIELSQPDDE